MRNIKAPRSILAFVLLFAILVQSIAIPVFAQETIKYGDVNGDGDVNSTDVDLLARYLAADNSVDINTDAADVDGNSVVDLNDLLYLVKAVNADSNITLGSTVTVYFETYGGTAIDPIEIVTGGTITPPEAKKENCVFLGWYTDEAFENPFFSSDPITNNITVYAKYQEVSGEPEYTPAAFALRDQASDIVFCIERFSSDLNPEEAVSLTSVDGSVSPELYFDETAANKWDVIALDGYVPGGSYVLTLAEGYKFAGKDESIREASFFIYKEEIANLTTNDGIIYIRDTAEMTYSLSDGTSCEVLDSAVLYNSDDVITGTFSYSGSENIKVGDTLCLYVTTNPTKRDYINENYDDDPAAYIVVEAVGGSTIAFRGMSMQGDDSDVEKLISLPSTIPFSVLNLPEGNGTIDFGERDIAAIYTMYNTGAPEEAKVGDFLAFYIGNFGSMREGDPVCYKRVTAVKGTTITYVESSHEELVNAVNLFLKEGVEGDKMLENIDQKQLESQVMQQVEQTGFAEDALKYLSSVVGSSDEFYDYVKENKITVYDENGVQLTEEQIRAYGLGNSFELADDVELSFNITTCDGENSHFENGIKVTLKIEAEFEVDIGSDGKMGSLKIELGAAFTQEVCIDVSINASADITWILCIPKFNDIVFSSAVDVMSYTGVSIEAKFYTQEPDEDFFDKLKENWGDTLGESAMKKIEAFKKDYEEKFDEDSLGEDIEGFWEAQTDLINSLIADGEITEEQAEACMESRNENHIVQTFFSKAHIMDDEEYNAGIVELAERYADMLGEEDNGWLELCKIKIFDVPINLWIFQISIEGNFVVRANVNIALGANLEYEIGKRYVNWFSIFGNGSGAEEIDLIDERFAFQFYAMGHVGLKAGILIEIKVGIISTKIGNVGISAEVGAFAELYGYFQYTYTKTRPSGGKDWNEEETLMGALYFEFGLYVDINVKAELLSLLEKSWEVFSKKWTLLSAGSKTNIYGFATELQDGEKIVIQDEDNNSNNGITYTLSEEFRAMKTLDMVSGDQDTVIKPWISYYGYNFWDGDDFSLTTREDKVNFTYSFTSERFSLVPVYEERNGKQYIVDYKISVDVPDNVHYIAGELRLVWSLDKLCWSKYDMAITIPLVWTDLATEELTEYKTATVKVGNEQDGYRTVWSDRFIKGSSFELPSDEKILKLADYAGDNDLRYSGYSGYTHTNRGTQIDSKNQDILFDTIYYFDMTTREYSITVNDVQNLDGTTKDMTFRAKYGAKFDFSALNGTGTESNDVYTIFSSIDTMLAGEKTEVDPTQEIKGNFAQALYDGSYTYHARYVRNYGEVTYKFSGVDLEPITKIYKKGDMPSANDFLPVIDALVGEDIAYVSSITPTISSVLGDVVYSVTVTLPEKEPEKYTITYVSNGGTEVEPQVVEERAAMWPPSNPTRTGYTFDGWYYDSKLTKPVSWDREMPSMNFKLYAKWTPNNYTITFNAGEGAATGTSLNVTFGKALGTLPTATRPNYIFLGWFTDVSEGTEYTNKTVYNTDGNITLYAHWQIKATIEASNFKIDKKTTTYDGSNVWITMSNDLGLDSTSLTVSYKRQNIDTSWSTKKPSNAGTYDMRIQRAEDDKYLACDHTFTGVLVINKASREFYGSTGLTIASMGNNVFIKEIPAHYGGGQPMFALQKVGGSTTSFSSKAGYSNLADGEYKFLFYITEDENYLQTNTIESKTVTISEPKTPNDYNSVYYYVVSYTNSNGWVNPGTGKPVYVNVGYKNNTVSSDTRMSNVDSSGDVSTDKISSTYLDPWMLKFLRYRIDGSNAWLCSKYEFMVNIAGVGYCYKYDGEGGNTTLINLDNSHSNTIEFGDLFKRWITGVGDFTDTVDLIVSDGEKEYVYTYDGKTVDNFASWFSAGYYNAFMHMDAPTLELSCDDSRYDKYFWYGVNAVHIDRDGLYDAMSKDGVSSICATATLSFNTESTAGGNTWTKTFNISIPTAAAVSEELETYYTSGDSNVTVQTQENEDYLYVTLGLSSNPGIWGLKNTVKYDKAALNIVSVEMGDLTSAYTVKCTTDEEAGSYTLLAYRESSNESYATGKFATLTFKKTVASVDLGSALTLNNDQTIDDRAQSVDVNGILNVGDFTSVPPSDDNEYLEDENDIVNELFEAMREKKTDTLTFHYRTNVTVTEDTLSSWFYTAKNMLSRYDEFGVKRFAATASKYTKEDTFYYTLTYKMDFYLTAEQENELNDKLDEVLNSLNLVGKTDLQKIAAVYACICDNVVYDESAENCFTAYGALIDGRAVCQGYALLMMRMLGALDIESDVVVGTSSDINHMWNIVKIGEEYYLLDVTWDSESDEPCYEYFLKGSNNFANHAPTESYTVILSDNDHSSAHTLSHSFANVWSYDANNHWYKCNYCEAENLVALHTDVDHDHVCDDGCAATVGKHADEDGDRACDYGCDKLLGSPIYTVTIPANVNVGGDLTVSLSDAVLSNTETLTVTLESSFMLTNEDGAQLPFVINNGNITNGSTVMSIVGNNDPESPMSSTKTLRVAVTREARYSGTYTGTITFTIAVKTGEETE